MGNDRFPMIAEWDTLDFIGALELGILSPRSGFVEAEELEAERRERIGNEGPAKNLRQM